MNMEFLLFDGPISNYDVIGVFMKMILEKINAGYVVWDGTNALLLLKVMIQLQMRLMVLV